jgi:adenine/guanine phosphoribosyltransferase-like PRPP-binding protein
MKSVHHVAIGSQTIALDILPLPGSQVAVSLLMTLDEGWRFNRTAGADLAERLRPAQPEVIVAPVTLGIPIMLYTAEALQIDSVPIYKTPKFHFGDALQVQVTSITTPGQAQSLYLDRRLVSRVAGTRIAVVDDVVNTAGTLRGVLELVRMAGGEVVRIGVLLTEGHDWRARLGDDAQLLVALGHIPMFQSGPDSTWVPIAATLDIP